MDSLRQKAFFIGDWKVSPTEGLLFRGEDIVHLEPKAMELLVYLAQRQGEVVTREDIEKDVWGGALVSYDSITSTIIKLRKALQDSAKEPDYIATIPKRGYELIAPVTEREDSHSPESTHSKPLQNTKKATWYYLFAGILVVTVGIYWFVTSNRIDSVVTDQSNMPPISREKIAQQSLGAASIAVLPFENMSDEPEQQYFSDGITDDLITDLTKLSGLRVISRESTFRYRGGAEEYSAIAERLQVQYILHGSVRRSNGLVRINAQLVDTATETQIWADRYDGDIHDLFSAQDQFTRQIVNALALKLTDSEQSVLERQDTENIAAYEKFLRGEEQFYLYSRIGNQRARRYFEDAIDLDEYYASAYAMLAWTYTFDFMNGWSASPDESLVLGESLASKALELNDSLPVGYFVKGLVYRERGEYIKALVEAEKVIELDPSYANAHVFLATLLYYAGRPEEGLARIKQAIKLNPHHPYNYPFHLGQAYFILRQYEDAIAAFTEGLSSNPASERLRIWLAASYSQFGNIEDARWEIEQVLATNPGFRLDMLERAFPFSDPDDLDHFMVGLRKAGLTQ